MIKGITFSDENMTISLDKCMESMRLNGFDDVRGYNETWWKGWEHTDTFEWLNKDILSQERGCGYWIWKSWCVADAMRSMKDGDYIVYSDAGVEWIENPKHIIDVMDQDVFLFSNGHQHVHWCKMDVMAAINPHHGYNSKGWEPNGEYATYQQVQASVIFFKVNDFTRRFVKEWLLWCQFPGFIDDSPSVLPNHPEFAEHRHDQSVLTCLQIKYGLKLHWWPDKLWYLSQRYRWPEDQYPPMLLHNRKRNNEWQ